MLASENCLLQLNFGECTFFAARDVREAFHLLPEDDGFAGGLSQSCSLEKRTSEASLPSTALKHSSECFVFLDLHRDPVQSEEVATLGDDLPSKSYRRILFAARAQENSEQLGTGKRLRTLR
jgi:hypothetical protein